MNYKNRYDGIGVLETAHAAAIMIYVLSNDDCRKTDIYRSVSHTATMAKKIEMLEASGLLKQVEMPRGTNVVLTEAGREVASYLSKINDIIASNASEP